MYENPVLFAQITNRETWLQTIIICDDDTGDPIDLTDADDNPLYAITCEIRAARPRGGAGYGGVYYDTSCGSTIIATLANYITIVDTGTFVIMIPPSVMRSLRARTYDVFLSLDSVSADDSRTLLLGRLPVLHGGMGPPITGLNTSNNNYGLP